MDRWSTDVGATGPAGLAIGPGLSDLLSAVLAVDPLEVEDPFPADGTGTTSPAVGESGHPAGKRPALVPVPADLVERAAGTLSPDVRTFVHAYFRDGQPIDTAAARLGISRLDALALRSAAVTRLTEALIELRRA